MDFIAEIFSRADIKQLCSFLIYGTDTSEPDNRPYRQQLDEQEKCIFALLQKYLNQKQYEKAENILSELMGVYESVFLEIGIRVGFSLGRQVFQEK